MRKQSGFTLIELVIVIIILGILAATAVPKFIDLQGDARASALQGVKAALEGGATLTYSQAAIQGIEKSDSEVETKSDVMTKFGYPTAAGILDAIELSEGDWATNPNPVTATDNSVKIYATASSASQATCNVEYNVASVSVSTRLSITVTDTGC